MMVAGLWYSSMSVVAGGKVRFCTKGRYKYVSSRVYGT